jgi:hypothetical protein
LPRVPSCRWPRSCACMLTGKTDHPRLAAAGSGAAARAVTAQAGTGYGYLSGGRLLAPSGDWDSGNPAFAISRGSPGAPSLTPGHGHRFPGMLFSLASFRIPVSHQIQRYLLSSLPAARAIQQCASWRTRAVKPSGQPNYPASPQSRPARKREPQHPASARPRTAQKAVRPRHQHIPRRRAHHETGTSPPQRAVLMTVSGQFRMSLDRCWQPS